MISDNFYDKLGLNVKSTRHRPTVQNIPENNHAMTKTIDSYFKHSYGSVSITSCSNPTV